MNLYLKRYDKLNHLEVIELTDTSWLSITKKLNKVGNPLYELYIVEHSEDDYDGSVWWKNSKFHIEQKEFDSVKNEFLTWVDNTLKNK